MRVTALERYGLRCLVTLARQGPNRQLTIAEIAEMEGLSVAYASKLLSILRQAGLVTAVRGRGGGFCITRHPSEVSLLEVITALGGPLIEPDHCARFTGQLDRCVHTKNCSVYDVLDGLAGYLGELLANTKLQDLVDCEKHSASTSADSYITTGNSLLSGQLARKRNVSGKTKTMNSKQ